MFDSIRTLREKDINSTQLGKTRSYKLTRGGLLFSFKGMLLGFYHIAGDSLDQEVQNQTHLTTIAIFKTQNRYIIYYALEYKNNDHIEGRKTHIHATSTLEDARRFIDAMTYPNKKTFAVVTEDASACEASLSR